MKLILLICMLPALVLAQNSKWSTETELSTVQTGGNTELQTYNLNTESELKTEKRVYSFGGHYTLGTGQVEDPNDSTKTVTEETARNWDVHAKYEQVLSKKFNGFIKTMYEGNEFAGIKQRENADLGAKYKIHEMDDFQSSIGLGYRQTIEKTTVRNDDGDDVFNDQKGRFFYQLNHKIKEGLSYKFWTEYIYNFTRPEDYLINFEPSVSFAINNTFSFKTSYRGMYDNDPAVGVEDYLDWTYTNSIIAKF